MNLTHLTLLLRVAYVGDRIIKRLQEATYGTFLG